MDDLRPLNETNNKPIVKEQISGKKGEEFFSPNLGQPQVADCAKKLFRDFSSLEKPTALLTEESLTEAIKKEAGDSKTNQLLIATQLRDLVSEHLQVRRDNASRIHRNELAAYSRETQNIQNFFKTIETVLNKFGS